MIVVSNFQYFLDLPAFVSFHSIHRISLQIEEGSLVAVVGAMGSGKSSLLAAMLGELHVNSGHVTLNVRLIKAKCIVWYIGVF